MFPNKQAADGNPIPSELETQKPWDPQHAMLVALALAFIPYFAIRGWLNAAAVAIGLFCVLQLALGRVCVARLVADRRVAWLLAALAAPLLAVAAVQLLRQEFVPRYFDAPARLLLSGAVMLYLMERRIDFLRIAGLVFPAAVLLCAAVLLYPGASAYHWPGNRVATYFMDPLTLAQHVTIAGFLCLFLVDAAGKDPAWLRALKFGAFFAAMAISVATQSRTGWTMVPILAAVWLIGFKRNGGAARISLVLLGVAAACVVLYWTSPVVHTRVDMAITEVVSYFTHDQRDTSIGLRISLFRANWILFMQSPLVGWGFASTPVVGAIPEIAAFTSPMFEALFKESGGHNEIMQGMMRMGVFGLVSRVMLFIVPLVLFTQAARSQLPRQRTAAYLGLTVATGYFMASLFSEVFNLVYAASFYGLLVAAVAATAFSREEQR